MLETLNWTFHFFFMSFFFVLAGVLSLRLYRDKKSWLSISRDLGLVFHERHESRLEALIPGFELFIGGHPVQATQVLTGFYAERELTGFNWLYRADDRLQTVRGGFACVVVRLSAPQPLFQLIGKGLIGFSQNSDRDRMLLADEPFFSRYLLRCRDRVHAQGMLPDRVKRLLMDQPDLWIEISRNQVLIAHQGELTPTNLRDELDRVVGVLSLMEPLVS